MRDKAAFEFATVANSSPSSDSAAIPAASFSENDAGWPMFENLKVQYLDPALLKPYANNARTHPKRQIDQIVASIEAFGPTNPILVTPALEIIAGHGRLIAYKKLGLSLVPVIILARLSPAQVRALRIADNKIALNSGWDVELLRLEIPAIQYIDATFNVELTGFSVGEIDILQNPKDTTGVDDIPTSRSEPRSRFGDIWQLGDHRVGCGDSRDSQFLRTVIGADSTIDCAFLDPPWNVSIRNHANVKARHREFAMASGEMTKAEFTSFLFDALRTCVEVSRNGAIHFVCMDWRHIIELSLVSEKLYGEQLNLCVWNKSNSGMGSLYRSKHELIAVHRVGSASHTNNVELGRHGRHRTNVWDYASVNGGRRDDLHLHPTAKPVAMVAEAIQDVTRRGELILDTFLGSGTTLIASERTGRRFRGLDVDPQYVDVAIDRWADMTGGTPRLIVPGDTA